MYRHLASKNELIREVLLQRDALIFESVDLHTTIVQAADAKRLSGIFMLLLDDATVETRASNDPKWAAEAWHAAMTLLMQAMPTVSAPKKAPAKKR